MAPNNTYSSSFPSHTGGRNYFDIKTESTLITENNGLKSLLDFLTSKNDSKGHPYLAEGVTGKKQVNEALQKLLVESGAYRNLPPLPPGKSDVDGVVGDRTRAAIKLYEKEHGPIRGIEMSVSHPHAPVSAPVAKVELPHTIVQPNYKTLAAEGNAYTDKNPLSSAINGAPLNYQQTKDGVIARTKLEHAPGSSGEVALFTPNGFDPNKPAVMIPYYHGNDIKGHKAGIQDALDRQHMTEMAAKSGKNVVFVIPQLDNNTGVKPQFKDPNYSGKFLNESSQRLADLYKQSHPLESASHIDNVFAKMPVVPVGYSNGYIATQATLDAKSDHKIAGVVLLDSMYGGSAPFTNFSHKGGFVSALYTDYTAKYTEEYMRHAPPGTAFGTKIHTRPENQFQTHALLVQNSLGDVLKNLSIEEGKVSYHPAQQQQQKAGYASTANPGMKSGGM